MSLKQQAYVMRKRELMCDKRRANSCDGIGHLIYNTHPSPLNRVTIATHDMLVLPYRFRKKTLLMTSTLFHPADYKFDIDGSMQPIPMAPSADRV